MNSFYNVLQPSLKDLQLHYMDTDGFVLSFTEGNGSFEYMDLSNLDTPIKKNIKIPGEFKHEIGSKEREKFVVLKPKTYSFKNGSAKEKRWKKENNGKYEYYYNPLKNNEKKTVEECRIQKVEDKTSTIETSKTNPAEFGDENFIENHLLDNYLYLFKQDLINKINAASLEKLVELEQLIGKELIIEKTEELTIVDDKKLILAAIKLYNDLP